MTNPDDELWVHRERVQEVSPYGIKKEDWTHTNFWSEMTHGEALLFPKDTTLEFVQPNGKVIRYKVESTEVETDAKGKTWGKFHAVLLEEDTN